MQQPAGQEAQERRNKRQRRNKRRWQGTRRHEERRCNSQTIGARAAEREVMAL